MKIDRDGDWNENVLEKDALKELPSITDPNNMLKCEKKIKEILSANPLIIAAFVHGSVAKGTARNESDLDLAVIMIKGRSLSGLDLLKISGEISQFSGREVHLAQLSLNTLYFCKQVIEHGILLFTNDQFQTDLFCCTALAMYIKLKEDSKEVINAYRTR